MARTALITGGAGGLGKAMAAALLDDGLNVVIADIEEGLVDEVLHDHAAVSDRFAGFTVDLAEEGGCERLVRLAEERFGSIDILVNNAGISLPSIRPDFLDRPIRFWEVSSQMFELFFTVNSTAPFRLASLTAPKMIAKSWGRIINVTTSLDTMLRLCFYGGSKAALEAHTSGMAFDLENTGVTANVLVPGGMTASRMSAATGIPLDQMHKPEIMAGPIRWLASEASDGVTARRFVAVLWDNALSQEAAARQAGSPVGWTGFGAKGLHPSALTDKLKI